MLSGDATFRSSLLQVDYKAKKCRFVSILFNSELETWSDEPIFNIDVTDGLMPEHFKLATEQINSLIDVYEASRELVHQYFPNLRVADLDDSKITRIYIPRDNGKFL